MRRACHFSGPGLAASVAQAVARVRFRLDGAEAHDGTAHGGSRLQAGQAEAAQGGLELRRPAAAGRVPFAEVDEPDRAPCRACRSRRAGRRAGAPGPPRPAPWSHSMTWCSMAADSTRSNRPSGNGSRAASARCTLARRPKPGQDLLGHAHQFGVVVGRDHAELREQGQQLRAHGAHPGPDLQALPGRPHALEDPGEDDPPREEPVGQAGQGRLGAGRHLGHDASLPRAARRRAHGRAAGGAGRPVRGPAVAPAGPPGVRSLLSADCLGRAHTGRTSVERGAGFRPRPPGPESRETMHTAAAESST